MENVVLTVHLILSFLLIGIVLLQRSEGGGLGMGGGGGAISGRAAATALGKITWGLAIAFFITSISLTVMAASDSNNASVIDQFGGNLPAEEPSAAPAIDAELPPAAASDAPAAPPAAAAPAATDAPAAPAPAKE